MLTKATSYVLTLVLLLSTLHISVYTHTCTLFNKSETSLFSGKNCCCEGQAMEVLGVKCCHSEVKIFASTVEANLEVQADFRFDFFTEAMQPDYLVDADNFEYFNQCPHTPPPPNETHLTRLAITQVFRI